MDIADGLAGWYQLHHVQNLGGLSGEDSARFITAQVVNAQGNYVPNTSALPRNWGTTKLRVDVALNGRSANSSNWYGAIEIKWPGDSFDVKQTRLAIVQDVARLAFIETANLNAKFLVLGGSKNALGRLFDVEHARSGPLETSRQTFRKLLPRQREQGDGVLLHSEWSSVFPATGDRIPLTVFGGFRGRLKTKLLAVSKAFAGSGLAGIVYVWQCSKTRGPCDDQSS